MKRPAYTLLEMLLALAIAVLLLGALYVSMEIQLQHADAARDIVRQTTLARSLLNRMAADLTPTLGMPDPTRYQSGSATGTSGVRNTAGNPSSTSSPGGSSSSGSSTSGTSETTGNVSATASNPTLLVVQGDSSSLTVFVSSQVPRDPGLTSSQALLEGTASGSDLRRITYWLAGGGDSPLGLARHELSQVTSDDAGLSPPEVTDPLSKQILASEVKSLEFSYFDGTSWQDSWDGTTIGADDVTPIGPPVAIAITIGLAPRSAEDEEEVPLKYYRHVVAIPTANMQVQQQSTESTTTQPSTTDGTTP